MSFAGYAIIPPVSPWDEKHREAIQMDNARRTIGKTEAEAWAIHCRFGLDGVPKREQSRRIQHWHDRGYRVVAVRVEFVTCPPHRSRHPRKDTVTVQEAAQLAEIDEQITQAELVALFGDRMPIEIAAVLAKEGGYASRLDARRAVNAAILALADGDGT